ncbi:MAG TPA: nucleotidyltransferase family protein [Nocardioides sp.]|nr:nucleotidyltransferase family protein [Nocardioides sp.]
MLAVSSRAWSELLHAQVGTLLGRADIPCLHIKGPTIATWQALYADGERTWGDVDILVPPSGMDRALDVLLASGFSLRDPGLRWRTSEDHALTLWHDPDGTATHGAAAEVDVHHRFQGMDGDPERVFAELWRRREPARLADLDVWFPDLTSRSLILVLNAARDPHGARAREDLRRLVAVATDADWRRTTALARRVGALQALRAGLEQEPRGRDLVAHTSLADVQVSAAWRLRSQGSTLTAIRIEELRSLGTVAKIRTMTAWVVPSPAVIRYRDPRAADSTWRLLRAYAARYRQGATGLRRSARELRALRRQRREGGP